MEYGTQGAFKAAVSKAHANQGRPQAGVVHSIGHSEIPGHHKLEIKHGDHVPDGDSDHVPGSYPHEVMSTIHLPKGHGHSVGDVVHIHTGDDARADKGY